MGDSLPVNPNLTYPPNPNPNVTPPPALPCAPAAPPPPPPRFLRRSPIRATTEFDSASENPLFHKISCKVIDGLAKLKFCCQSNSKGYMISPEVAFITDRFKVFYDVDSRNALLQGWLDMGRFLSLQATHDVKNRGGDVALIAKLGDPSYKLELCSSVPAAGLPRATLTFPNGQVSVEEMVKEEAPEKVLSVNGIFRSNILDGVGTAMFTNDDLKLRYCYKDKELTFIPSISLPSNALSFAFKRRFSPSDKLSYFYNFDTRDWNAVYKHTARKDLKFKAGYDTSTDGGLKWACVWVGDERGGVKSIPLKMRFKLMLQVPQDINKSVFLFHVKKRWDFDF
ncbi:chloroplast outer envelope protein 37 isoform X2 [Carex rostrata]